MQRNLQYSIIKVMDLNDYRLNAYKNAARKTDGDNSGASVGGHIVKKPVFEQIKKTEPVQPPKPVHFQKLTETIDEFQKTKSQRPKYSPEDVKEATSALTSGGLLKVPSQVKDNGKDSVYRRVAKFLLLIGVDEAAKILPHLSDEQTEKIIPEIASIRTVSDDEATAILAEFQSLLQRTKEGGGVETAKTILSKAFGDKRATEMLEKTVQFPNGKPFEYLEDIENEKIILLLKDELPAIRALVLSYLKPQKAAKIINLLESNDKKEVILRLAKMEPISPEVLRRVDHAIHEKVSTVNTERTNTLDGRGALAQILKKMDPRTEEDILKNLSDEDPDLGQDLRKRLFTIEDIINADDRFLQEQLHKMENSTIAILIAAKPEEFRKKILFNVSKIRGDSILEEEQLKKPILRADSEKVTSQFFSTMRQAYEDGKFIIKGRSDDIYV